MREREGKREGWGRGRGEGGMVRKILKSENEMSERASRVDYNCQFI